MGNLPALSEVEGLVHAEKLSTNTQYDKAVVLEISGEYLYFDRS